MKLADLKKPEDGEIGSNAAVMLRFAWKTDHWLLAYLCFFVL